MKASVLAKQFRRHIISYTLAFNHLYKDSYISNMGELMTPICFLGRHTIELQIKTILLLQNKDVVVDKYLSFISNNKKYNLGTHDLEKLIYIIKELDKNLIIKVYTSDHILKIYNEIISLTKNDKNAEFFKYPITQKGRHNFNNLTYLDETTCPDISSGRKGFFVFKDNNFSAYINCNLQQASFISIAQKFYNIIVELNKFIGIEI